MDRSYQIFNIEHFGTKNFTVPSSNVDMTPLWDGNAYDGNILSFNTELEAEEYLYDNKDDLEKYYYVILPVYINN